MYPKPPSMEAWRYRISTLGAQWDVASIERSLHSHFGDDVEFAIQPSQSFIDAPTSADPRVVSLILEGLGHVVDLPSGNSALPYTLIVRNSISWNTSSIR